MHRIFRVKAYEMEHGPHFNEEHARKAVMKMENEDGTRGPHWSLEETSASTLGLTISTNKQEIINIVRSQYDTYKQRKEAIAKCDEEMAKCQQLLDKLEIHNEPTNENSKIVELQNEINELKNIIRKANQMVPPPMKDMLPQDMKDAMNKVDQ